MAALNVPDAGNAIHGAGYQPFIVAGNGQGKNGTAMPVKAMNQASAQQIPLGNGGVPAAAKNKTTVSGELDIPYGFKVVVKAVHLAKAVQTPDADRGILSA